MMSVDSTSEYRAHSRGALKDYVAIARLDHSVKHIFIAPGIVIALLLRGPGGFRPINVLLGLAAAICIASANYVINEYLDRDFDRFHPTKSSRAAVQKHLAGPIVAAEWMALAAIGVACAGLGGRAMLFAAGLFALQGVAYNVKPLRTKDKAYLDVISESVNNPLRLMIGWAMVDPHTMPPSSIILAYWLGGAFLMAAKRLSEYREIAGADGPKLLARYRASFASYSELSLLASCFVYALLSSFFLGVFLIKYRIEYILLMPVVAILFVHYLLLSMKAGSAAQAPEKLYRERPLMLIVGGLVATFVFATLVHIPALSIFTDQRYILLP
jgi:4-hydroxybenzoate polyprenyltransferase